MSLTATVSGSIQLSDTLVGNIPVSKLLALSNITLTGYEYIPGVTYSTGANSISFPYGVLHASLVCVVNTGATNALQVTWTPRAGASNIVVVLSPLSALLMIESDLTRGIDALTLTALVAATTADVLIAG